MKDPPNGVRWGQVWCSVRYAETPTASLPVNLDGKTKLFVTESVLAN
jgi:hypothetical protein